MNTIRTALRKSVHRHLLTNTYARAHSMNSPDYCLNSVKTNDYENFMCVLLLKQQPRRVALAVRAFNVELSKIADKVGDKRIGFVRLQFWEDALAGCYENDISKIPEHPVVTELHKVVQSHHLTKRFFTQLINSRREQFDITIFPTVEDQEKYCEQTISSLYYLTLEGADVRNLHADHVASHLGKAQGIVQQIKSVRFASEINAVFLPQNILAKHEVSFEEILRRNPSHRLNDSTYEVATRALHHLDKAENLIKDAPKEAWTVFLPRIPIREYLMKLQRFDFNPLHSQLHKRTFWWIPKMWLANQKFY